MNNPLHLLLLGLGAVSLLSATPEESLLVRGRALFQEFNCAACHEGDHLPSPLPTSDLTQSASRVRPEWLLAWLGETAAFKPHSRMPAVSLSGQDRQDIAAFLLSIARPERHSWSEGSSENGESLFTQLGCANCHKDDLKLPNLSEKWQPAALPAYLLDPLKNDRSGRMPGLSLSTREALDLSAYLLREKAHQNQAEQSVSGNPARGRSLVQSSGCVNCHTVTVNGQELASELKVPALPKEVREVGCLSNSPDATFRFSFTAKDREALLGYLRSSRAFEPAQLLASAQLRFRCQACHELEGQPPTGQSVHGIPRLTQVEHKLRPEILRGVLLQDLRERPWLATRMPNYGHSMEELLALWGETASPHPSAKQPSLLDVHSGVQLLGKGEGGLACLSCHDFKGAKSGGDLRGPDLARVHDRIRPEWIARWLRDPAQISPGTAMPNFFAAFSPKETDDKIRSIIAALSLGEKLPSLEGTLLDHEAYVLRVKDEPILFRSFIADASPQAIAVGLPGLVSYCFDAKESRLLYAWSGNFLDVRPVWADRGGEAARPLGQKFYTAPSRHQLRVGVNSAVEVRFKGYRLRQSLPEFFYQVDGVNITERLSLDPAAGLLVRHFEVGPSSGPLSFYSGEGETIAGQPRPPNAPSGWVQLSATGPLNFSTSINVRKPSNN